MPYLPVKLKYCIAICVSILWASFSLYIAQRWIVDLTELSNVYVAHLVIWGIAIIPGFMNAFLVSSLLMDRRPERKHPYVEDYPDITVLVAAYNESDTILQTLESLRRQIYPGKCEIIVVNDGSTDDTLEKLYSVKMPNLVVCNLPENQGKAMALNTALSMVQTELVITIDGDSYLYKDALINLVERYLSDPANTAAVAGAVLVRNSRENLVTKVQEWDYFHGIAAVKRVQSLFQGTLVAQGAFSIYKTDVVREVGGWPDTVGEDIVLTWSILKRGYRVGYAEDACLFTNAPTTWTQFFKQRRRWSRGLIEAFKINWQLLFKRRMTTLFIWWNLLFPYMDLAYTFAFIPGIVLAMFGHFWIVGPLTFIVLPLAMLVNFIMYRIQSKMFDTQRLVVRKNLLGFMFYSLLYSIILQPACVVGYISELFNLQKKWGTK